MNIQVFLILDCGYDCLKVFSVIRVCIVVFIGKAVIVVEIIRRIERGDVSQKEIYLLNFLISEKKPDFFIHKDCLEIGFL